VSTYLLVLLFTVYTAFVLAQVLPPQTEEQRLEEEGELPFGMLRATPEHLLFSRTPSPQPNRPSIEEQHRAEAEEFWESMRDVGHLWE
jgi:hypothetical protein